MGFIERDALEGFPLSASKVQVKARRPLVIEAANQSGIGHGAVFGGGWIFGSGPERSQQRGVPAYTSFWLLLTVVAVVLLVMVGASFWLGMAVMSFHSWFPSPCLGYRQPDERRGL